MNHSNILKIRGVGLEIISKGRNNTILTIGKDFNWKTLGTFSNPEDRDSTYNEMLKSKKIISFENLTIWT